MCNFHKAANVAFDVQVGVFTKRRKALAISQAELAEMVGVDPSTLTRNFQLRTMSHMTYLKICGALRIRPYMEYVEDDTNEFMYMDLE